MLTVKRRRPPPFNAFVLATFHLLSIDPTRGFHPVQPYSEPRRKFVTRGDDSWGKGPEFVAHETLPFYWRSVWTGTKKLPLGETREGNQANSFSVLVNLVVMCQSGNDPHEVTPNLATA